MKKLSPAIINEIAQSLDCGLVCFLNPDTLELVEIPTGVLEGTFDDEDSLKEIQRIEYEWKKIIRIDPLESSESYEIMERFVEEVVNNLHLKSKLQNILEGKKPFRNFKNAIDESDYRQSWFDFKQKCIEEYVTDYLQNPD
mgnify:CR=1 FL=1